MNRKGSKSVFLFFFEGKAERERKGRGREKNKRRHEGSDGRAARQFSWGLQIGNWTINDLGRVSAYLCTCYFDGGTSTPRQSAYLRSAPPSYRQNRSLIQSLLADSRFLSRRLAPIFSQFRVYFSHPTKIEEERIPAIFLHKRNGTSNPPLYQIFIIIFFVITWKLKDNNK